MSGKNNRVYFPCVGISRCNDSNILKNIISSELGLSINVNNILSPGKSSPIAAYSDLPDIDFSYTEYMQDFLNIENEYGLNDFVGWDLLVGLDASSNQTFAGLFSGLSNLIGSPAKPGSRPSGSPPYSGIRCSLSNLVSISHDMSVDGFFTTTRSYKGYSKKIPSNVGKVFTESQATPKRRQCYIEQLPSRISNNAVQNINVTYNFNRTPVVEFATRKPYASYINFPIETTVTFELLTQKLDSYVIDAMQTACQNVGLLQEDISITVSGGKNLLIKKAYLTSLRYSGASASSNDNQTISVTYTSYTDPCPPNALKPVITMPDADTCP